MLLAFER